MYIIHIPEIHIFEMQKQEEVLASGFGVMKAFILDSYSYLGVEFSCDGSWDKDIKSLIMHNRLKLGSLYRVLHNFALDLRTRRHILMAVLRSSLEYGCEVSKANKCHAKALESIQLCACMYVSGCSISCDEPMLAYLGLEMLKYRRDFRKLK